jgi:hypothetical protein
MDWNAQINNAMTAWGCNTPSYWKTGHLEKNQQRNFRSNRHNRLIEQMNLRVFHPATEKYIFLLAVCWTFSKIDHILGQKASLSKYKKIEIIPCILSDHNAVKVELNNKSKDKKYANSRKLNNSLLNHRYNKRGN